jgi:hypothetical protein
MRDEGLPPWFLRFLKSIGSSIPELVCVVVLLLSVLAFLWTVRQ